VSPSGHLDSRRPRLPWACAIIGAFNGFLTAYAKIPAFIVTLGGLIAYSGLAFLLAKGETVAPMDRNFGIFGGGVARSWLGPTWSWRLLLLPAPASSLPSSMAGAAPAFRLSLAPVWAEVFMAALGSLTTLGTTLLMNSYPWPPGVTQAYALASKIPIPDGIENRDGEAICMAGGKVVHCMEGLIYYTGYSLPALIAIAVCLAMTFIATRTTFGRYIYAAGGNPEAAELAGINTKMLTVKAFALMGYWSAFPRSSRPPASMRQPIRWVSPTNSM